MSSLLRRSLGLLIFLATGLAAQESEGFVIPLRVHLLRTSAPSDAGTTLASADVTRILSTVNTVWSQAGIRFEPERVVEEPPAGTGSTERTAIASLVPSSSFQPRAFNAYFIHRMEVNGILVAHGRLPAVFVKDTARLEPVPGGTDEPLARVLSHELGHALGLGHAELDPKRLMYSGTTGTSLNEPECKQARANAATVPWIHRTPKNR